MTETVTHGRFTYDNEGNDSGLWSSKVLHWPGGSSGVTIGRGYDMKHRTQAQVVRDLTNIGVDRQRAERIAQGASLTRNRARQFVRDNKNQVGEITTHQQIRLFNTTYREYEQTARQAYQRNASQEEGYTSWSNLSDSIKTIITDMVYHGAAYSETYKSASRNSKEELINHIQQNNRGDENRHTKRINYLNRENQ